MNSHVSINTFASHKFMFFSCTNVLKFSFAIIPVEIYEVQVHSLVVRRIYQCDQKV
jgi:hypothetical protein